LKEKARGDERKLSQLVLGIDKVSGLQSILGYHFNETRDFIKVCRFLLKNVHYFDLMLLSGLRCYAITCTRFEATL
jgi:hypothetical protein